MSKHVKENLKSSIFFGKASCFNCRSCNICKLKDSINQLSILYVAVSKDNSKVVDLYSVVADNCNIHDFIED